LPKIRMISRCTVVYYEGLTSHYGRTNTGGLI
jgi:hypothetical protein